MVLHVQSDLVIPTLDNPTLDNLIPALSDTDVRETN